MSFQPANSQQSYVPPSVILPEDSEQLRITLTEKLQRMIEALNDKDIGQYNTVELLCGQLYFTDGNPGKYRHVYRKVVDFGALPNAGTKNVAHGITWSANTRFTRIYGTSTQPSSRSIPLPYVDTTAGNVIELSVDTTNVQIITAANYTAYTDTYIVLEYTQE
jgi:protein involved in ribonucleotide reduction